MYLYICTNERHKCIDRAIICSFILGFAIYPVAYGVGFTLQGLPIVTWISNFKQQTIVGGQYFNVPKPTEFWVDHIKLTQRFGSCMVKDPPSDWVSQLFVG